MYSAIEAGPGPGASPEQKYPSTSARVRPASASAPSATSAWSCATVLSVARRVGCSNAPAIYALPLMVMPLGPPFAGGTISASAATSNSPLVGACGQLSRGTPLALGLRYCPALQGF